MSSLDDLRSLVDAQRIIDAQIRKLAIDALREGEPAWVSWRLQTLERLESWTRSNRHRRGTRLS